MEIAILIVSGIGSFFTAVAGVAAWRAASIAGREARERSKPYVTVGIPRADFEHHAIIVPIKNLGLGPAREVALQLKDDETVVSARLAAGVAPMESEEWMMFVVDRPAPEMPDPAKLSIEGMAVDASGASHPLFFLGGGELPVPTYKGGAIEGRVLDDGGADDRGETREEATPPG